MSCPVNEISVPAFDSSNCCKPEALAFVVEACEAISIKVTKVANLSVPLSEACMLKIVKKSYERMQHCSVNPLKVEAIGHVR